MQQNCLFSITSVKAYTFRMRDLTEIAYANTKT